MFSAILAIMLLPITDLGRSKGLQFRPISKLAFWVFVVNFLILMKLGACHVETPFIELGQLSTVLYFAHFAIIVPIVSLIENTLIDLITLKVSVVKLSSGKVPKGIRYFHVTRPLMFDISDIPTLVENCNNFYLASQSAYSQAISEYANLKVFMLQHGHTSGFDFNQDISIPNNVKEMASQKFTTVINHYENASDKEESANIILRAIHRTDSANINRTSITQSMSQMHAVKKAWIILHTEK